MANEGNNKTILLNSMYGQECSMSPVACHLSHVTCHIIFSFLIFSSSLNYKKIFKKKYYIDFKIGQGGGASWWRVCYQRGLTRLVFSDFVLQTPKSVFNTVRLEQVQTHCFSRQAHGATLGRIFFGFWSPKSDKQWKVLSDCLKKFSTGGPLGNQTFWLLSGSP